MQLGLSKKNHDKIISTLNSHKKRKYSEFLKEYKYLFGGTLGTWNTALFDLELKDGENPV